MKQKDVGRIIEMAWEDRTPFEAIQEQYKLTEPGVISILKLYVLQHTKEDK